MQLPFKIKLVPWKRAYFQAEKGMGGVIGLSKSDERLAIFDFSEPIFTEHIVLVVKKGRAFPFEKISDLKGKLIGVTNGTSYGSAYDHAVADGTMSVVGYNDIYSGLAMLQFERTDAVLLGSSVDLAKLALEDSRIKPELLEMLPVPFKSDSKHLGISKTLNMRGHLDRFDACLLRGHASGGFNPIMLEYAVD
jgi:ABC-type amino acid transport substrate-binding protein